MNIEELIKKLSLEEKAGLCSGEDCWSTKAIENKGIPALRMCDGPSGLRFQTDEDDHIGVHASVEMVSYPTGCAMASSFDRELMEQVGKALGEESRSVGVSVVLGPAANIKRNPLCGRNFEYLSEDPYLTGEMSSAEIKGIQSQGVGACMKHFACNNQETWRMKIDSQVDERALREIYLSGFEKAVKQSDPCAIMASYNRVNGETATENRHLLTEILRDEWGFKGFVVSDWGAVNIKAGGICAGMDLEMPGSSGITDKQLILAVQEGRLEEKVLDRAVTRILERAFLYASKMLNIEYDKEDHHTLAVTAAAESAVLLKNSQELLPLSNNKKIAFIGRFAENPRFQGGGSACVTPFKLTNALTEAEKYLKKEQLIYVPGFSEEDDQEHEDWKKQAIEAAENAEAAVIFAGLPDSFESECYDRTDMKLPHFQNEVIEAVCEVQHNVVVVLYSGSPVEMPWKSSVKAILQMHTGGQGVGEATSGILFGEYNPCGKLAETYPLRLEDTPTYISYPGDGKKAVYQEGIFVGYRYYDKKQMKVNFPFGYGLSYTKFRYDHLCLSSREINENDTVDVSVDITNVGTRAGKEIVQLYVAHSDMDKEQWKVDLNAQVYVSEKEGTPAFANRELKGFEKIALRPGETRTVHFKLNRRSFAYYDPEQQDWLCMSGRYTISVAASSRDIRVSEELLLKAQNNRQRKSFAMDSLMSEISPEPELWQMTLEYLASVNSKLEEIIYGTDSNSLYLKEELKELPMYAIRGIYSVRQEYLDELIHRLNQLQEEYR